MQDVRFVDGKKFLGDGRRYDSSEKAEAARSGYEADGFETNICEEEGKFLVYTRRVVKQADAQKQSA